ncbi:hypothetical protein APY94_11395 [Thermococcus celericrescens]|uniref:DUF2079 domain-containing protein n=1 Tax=Thermococcus celericrescens TaxID=227598 RepID=A0A100XVS8_9EURY|nr:DUF2079 domain-containing protein [Thermococcus celericrescens]KUH31918.1 hypothetical protein APY94_11395 [Thermococcus celericrescens]
MVIKRFWTRLSNYDVTAVFIALAYSALLMHFSLVKFECFRYTSLDLGIFTQSLAGFLHGSPLFNTVERQLYGVPNHLAVHFQPVLVLLVPVFAVFPTPKTLLVLQTLALGLSVLLAYVLARELLPPWEALAVTVLYAFNSSLVGINLFEFHPVSLAVPLFFLSAYFLIENRWRAFYATSFLLLLTKEDAFLGVTSLSLWWAFRDEISLESARKNRPLLLLAALSLLYGAVVIKLVIPALGKGYLYEGLYTRPEFGRRKLLYFLLFNLSLGLLPLFRSKNALLLTLPWLENLLASRPSQTTFGFHYPYMTLPLSVIGAVFALRELDLRRVLPFLLSVGLLASLATMPVELNQPEKPLPLVYPSVLEPIPGRKAVEPVIEFLSNSNLSVYTQPAFYPALATKPDVYVYPAGVEPDAVLVNVKTYRGRLYLERLQKMVNVKYRLVYSRDGVRLYVREGLNVSVFGLVPPGS